MANVGRHSLDWLPAWVGPARLQRTVAHRSARRAALQARAEANAAFARWTRTGLEPDWRTYENADQAAGRWTAGPAAR